MQLYRATAVVLASALISAAPALARPPAPDPIDPDDECWLWAAASGNPDQPLAGDELLWQLIDGDAPTVVNEARYDDDGWSVSWWTDGDLEPTVVRDPDGAGEDEDYALAADELAASGAHIAMAHFRSTTSGCEPETGNPHPFVREFEGRTFALQHNGTVSKSWLEEIIGSEYLAAHPPLTCPDNPVDSELILIFLLSRIEQRCPGVSVHDALLAALSHLAAGHSGGATNLVLSDGDDLWVTRLSSSNVPSSYELHYRTDGGDLYVAKEPINGDDWVLLDNLTLLHFPQGAQEPTLSRVSRRLELSTDIDGDGLWCDGGDVVDPGDSVGIKLLHLDPRGGTTPGRSVSLDLPEDSPLLGVIPTPDAFSSDHGLTWWPVSSASIIQGLDVTDLRWDMEGVSERLDATVVVQAGCTDPYLPFRATWTADDAGEAVASLHAVCSEVVEAEPVFSTNPQHGCGANQTPMSDARATAVVLAILGMWVGRRHLYRWRTAL